MIKSTDVHSNICTFFNLHPIYFYHYLCYNVRKGRDRYMQGRLSCLHEQSVLHISDERSDRGKPEVFRGALPVHAILCYLVLKKAFCDFCLSGFVMVSYKAIILTFSLRMIFLRVADIEHIKSHKGEISLWINSF